MSGGALISTIAGIKTIIKTIKTLKQTTPQGIHLLIYTMLQQNSCALCHGHHGPGGSDGVAAGPTRNCLRGKRRKTTILVLQLTKTLLLSRVREAAETTAREAGLDEVQS